MDSLDFLLYVDDEYVKSLYKYYFGNVIESTEGKTKTQNWKLGVKLFKSSLIPIPVEGENNIGLKNVSIQEKKIKPATESKIAHILEKVFNNKVKTLVDLLDIITENQIYYFQGVFELISLESKKGKDVILNKKYKNNPKGLVWKLKLITYEESDNRNVLMTLGGDKIIINYHHLTEEIEKYKRFPFRVLGKITKFNNYNFSIKPIVIFY